MIERIPPARQPAESAEARLLDPPDSSPLATNIRFAIFAMLVVMALVALLVSLLAWHQGLSVHDLQALIRSWGMWGMASSVGLMVLHTFVPFPAELLALADGMLYGPVWGTVITWIGAMLGASLAFALAKLLGRPFVVGVVARRNWHHLDEWSGKQGVYVILALRLMPVIAFNLINYAAGLTRMSWWTFLWTTGIGILPLTIVMVVMGDSLERITWSVWVVLAVVLVATWLLVMKLRRHVARRHGH